MTASDDDDPPFVIRRARIEERRKLVDLQRRASLHWPSSYSRALIEHPEMIDVPAEQITGGQVIVATLFDAVLGFATVLPLPDGKAELDAIFVEPRNGDRGIGRMLIAASIDKARALGARSLDVVANPQVESFYLACGFIRTGTVMTWLAPAPTMTLPLASSGSS